MTRRRWTATCLVAGILLAGCSLLGPAEDDDAGRRTTTLDPLVSMTPAGQELAAAQGVLGSAPSYRVTASVSPTSGRVHGVVRAELPVGTAAREARFRLFAGLRSVEADPTVGAVTVDKTSAEPTRADSIVTVPLPKAHGQRVRVTVPFAYRVPVHEPPGLLDALSGMGTAADVGLLARGPDVLNLGHWFPIWIPAGLSAQPDPQGYGDIGNFPAALIRLELTVPDGWTVIDGGVRTGEARSADTRTVHSEAVGMRDLVVSVVRDYTSRERRLTGDLAGVTVTAHGPRDAASELDGVLTEAVAAVETLSRGLGAYPWRELDVVSAPLGAGVGGMEWPGAVWIESELFSGGIPGLSSLEDLDGLEDLLGGADLDELLSRADGDLALTLDTMRAWTIAHEVGHEWWHVLVGNDSVLHPVVDEPLAQYSACVVLRASPAPQGDVCAAHLESGYGQMRMLGMPDGAAARRTDRFESSLQYSGLVYGKAAAFYLALEEEVGEQAVQEALARIVEENAFGMVTAKSLRDGLARHLGDTAAVDSLWRRWMREAHGDEDLSVPAAGSDLGDLKGLLDGLLPGAAGGGG